MNTDVKYFKGLDGIRAIAAFGVLFSHLNMSRKFFHLLPIESVDLGGFGVTIFFALSGFLITYLLMKEKNVSQTINVKYFYIRRILRIWPLYFFYILLALITLMVQHKPIGSSLGYYLLLIGNVPFIMGVEVTNLGHLWSIGVEEQFYLFWPWLMKRVRDVLRVVIIFTVTYIALRIVFRILEVIYGCHLPYLSIHVTRFDCMGIGAIGALLFFKGSSTFYEVMIHPVSQLAAWAVIVLLFFNMYHIASVIDHEIVSVLTVVIIINVSQNPSSLIKLDYKFFDFLGRISYGIYVYHPLIISLSALFLEGITITDRTKMIILYIVIPLITVFTAYCSYSLLEKYFLKRKTSFVIA